MKTFHIQHPLESTSHTIDDGEELMRVAFDRCENLEERWTLVMDTLGRLVEHAAGGDPRAMLDLAGLGHLDLVRVES